MLVSLAGRAAAVLLLVTVLADVALRYVLSQPIPGSIEYVSSWHMVAIAFFGFALAERSDEHIDAPIIFDRLPPEIRLEFTIVGRSVFLAVLLAMTWWGWDEAVRQHSVLERGGAAGVPIWPTRYFVPIGGAACALEVLAGILDRVRSGRDDLVTDVTR